ncbi:MAG: transcriptional repressor [Candidatus Peribacteraceae bacterium]|nr:transcriptional repressor [Candidatus Peribacteraceae bacterium]
MDFSASVLLRQRGLKETLPRLSVLRVLAASAKPLLVKDILHLVRRKEGSIGLVTVYRVIEALAQTGLLHRHPIDGGYSLCAIPDIDGHHVLLRCTACGRSEEAHDHDLCRREDAVARRVGFRTSHHLTEMLGTCSHCH